MSTIRATLIATATVAALGMAAATSHRQTGTAPQKLTGPSAISVTATSLVLSKKTTFPQYTVELNQMALSDTVITITDVYGHIIAPATVTVLAGSSSAKFSVSPNTVGSDRLVASNANGYTSMDVTVTSG